MTLWLQKHKRPPVRRSKKFKVNPAHPSFQLERLRSDSRFWSVRVTRDCRAVAQRCAGDLWVWIWIGSHKDFDRQFKV
jgi:hypothetical protein